MQILIFLTILNLHLPSIIGQIYNNSIIAGANIIPAINSLQSPNNIIDDSNTHFDSQDLFSFNNASQQTKQISKISNIGATPDFVEILSFIYSFNIMIAISHQGKILILYDISTNCYDIYNISDLVSPTIISSISFDSLSLTNQAGIISTNGKTAFFTLSQANSGELVIVDLSNPVYPNIMATYPIPAGATSLTISPDDKTLFVYGGILTIIDISDRTSPTNMSSFTPPTSSPKDQSHMKLHLHDNNLFLKDGDKFYILDVSNLESPEILATINTTKSVDAVISSDGKYAFILSSYDPSQQFYIDIYDISDITSIRSVNSFPIGTFLASNIYQSMDISPDNDYLYIAGCESLVIVNISNVSSPYPPIYDASSIPWPYEVTLSPDGLNAFVVVLGELLILDLHFKPQLNLEINVTSQFPAINGSLVLQANSMAISSDSKTIFMQSPYHLEIINVTNITSPSILSIFNITNPDPPCQSVIVSPDDATAFLVCNTSIIILDISNLTSPTPLQAVLPPSPSFQFVISPDGKTGFLLTLTGMQIINLTDLSAPNTISTYNCSTEMTPNLIELSEDGRTAFILFLETTQQNQMEIVDISDLSSPTQIYSAYISSNSDSDTDYYPTFIYIEPDSGITTVTFDLSDYDFTYVMTTHSISSSQPLFPELICISSMPVVFSAVSPTAYIVIDTGLLIVDISDVASPIILRAFPIETAVSLVLSADESTVFLGMNNGLLAIIDLTPQYSLYLLKRNFVLGEGFQSDIVPLQLSSSNMFTAIDQDLSILQVSLYNIDLVPLSSKNPVIYTALPSWITFDKNQGILTFSPCLADQIGLYQIYVVLSTVIPDDAFIGIGSITNTTESLDLYVSLITLGYIDTQGYLTSSFNPNNKRLFLTSQYSQYQSQIFNTLLQYYIQVITTISVSSSLSLESVTYASATPMSGTSYSKTISINTQSQNSLSVTIALETNQTNIQTQFVRRDFSVVTIISTNQTIMNMEGALVDINAALTQVIINLDDGKKTCNGTITVSDGMNLPLTQHITNISDYFILNKPPVLNNNFSIQTQVSQTPIFTGEQFIIDMNNMFIDPNNQDLTYSLTMQDSTQQPPEWLMLRGETIIGTPPDQLSHSEINLVIIASNQFKSTSQQFTISIKISLLFALKLIAAYGGPLITVIGLYVYIGTIYNILCKKRYRYPKNFTIKVGDQNSVQNICSFSFIKEEVRVSRLILDDIMKNIAQERKHKTVTQIDLVNFFIDPDSRQLDEDKLTKMIKVGLSRINGTETKKDETSPLRFHLRMEVIKQIIVNKLVNQRLDLVEETLTKKVFNRIKDDWVNLGETSRDSSFKLNQHKLEKKLRTIGIQSYKPQPEGNPPNTQSISNTSGIRENVQTSTQTRNFFERKLSLEEDKSQEMSLINLSEKRVLKEEEMPHINFNLLEKVIIAHSFKYHNLNANALEVEVVLCERTFGNSLYHKLKTLFKRDLYRIKFVKGCEIGYGITYTIHKGVLRFYGTPYEDLKGRTVVIQIMNRRGRILSEIWLDCLAKVVEEEEMLSKQQSNL